MTNLWHWSGNSSFRLTDTGRWYVYGLFSSLDRSQRNVAPFYVGMAKNVLRRCAGHLTAKAPVRSHVEAVVAAGGYVDVRVMADYATRQEAARREVSLIRCYPDLINRVGYGNRKDRYRRDGLQEALGPVADVVQRAMRRPVRAILSEARGK